MKVSLEAVTRWIVMLILFGPLGCSLINAIAPENKPPPPPAPRKIAPPVDTRPEEVIPQAAPEATHFVHKIKWAGENLILIARWYTGTGNNWLRLVEANPSIDPRRIKIGDSILIPDSLLKTREPMPNSYISTRLENSQESPVPPAAPLPPPPQEVELFGPVDIETPNGRPPVTGSSPPLESIE